MPPTTKVIRRTVALHPAQRAFRRSGALYRGFVGGRGAGKSWVGAHDLLCRAKPGRLYLAGAPTYPMLRDSTWRMLVQLSRDLGLYAAENMADHKLVLATGAEILGRSFDNPERARGPNLSGAWLDEASQMAREAFDIVIACLREGGEAGWLSATYTPRGPRHWTAQTFNAGKPNTEQFHARTADNPFVPPAFVEAVRSQYTSVYAAQELEGRYVELGGVMIQRQWFDGKIVDVLPCQATARVRYWDTACLVAGTMVETAGGAKPIETIKPGEFVLTRDGYRRVKWAGLTTFVDEVVSVTFSNGATLTGTPDHLVWTENNGWTELGRLCCGRYNTSITQGGDTWASGADRSGTPILRLLNSTASPTRAGRGDGTSRRCAGTRKRSAIGRMPCTGPSGDSITVRFPTDMTSITWTAIGTTTTSRIWTVSRRRITSAAMTRSPRSMARHGTGNTSGGSAVCLGRRPSTKRIPACSAGSNSNRGVRTLPAFVQSLAAVDLVTLSGKRAVYDLQVDGIPEFFANGILVHNSSENAGAYTAGVLMGKYPDGTFGVEDVVRGRWSAGTRDRVIRDTAELDALRSGHVTVYREQEPGGSGKEVGEAFVRMMAGFAAHADRVTGDKADRFQPFAAQVEHGNVLVRRAGWTDDWLDEVCSFPEADYLDQSDATGGAFNKLATAGGGTMAVPGGGPAARPKDLCAGGVAVPRGGVTVSQGRRY